MKRIIFLITAIIAAVTSLNAQDDGERKLTKKERKAIEARIDSMKHANMSLQTPTSWQ